MWYYVVCAARMHDLCAKDVGKHIAPHIVKICIGKSIKIFASGSRKYNKKNAFEFFNIPGNLSQGQ